MNDKGAGGTGHFFEVILGDLGARLEDFGRIILDSPKGCKATRYLYCLCWAGSGLSTDKFSNAFGFDPVWMGLLMLISISLGLLTPPFGLLLFILRGNSPEGTSMMDVYRASLSYIYPTILGLALFIIFPGNATWLPLHM